MTKILIVDDSVLDRTLLINVIKKSGIDCEIIQATDGENGLQVLSANHKDISLILLDWQMPKMNGLEFMEGVVKVPAVAKIPIVMVSASVSEENIKSAKKVNPNLAGYLVKPYKTEVLLNTIQPLLNKG